MSPRNAAAVVLALAAACVSATDLPDRPPSEDGFVISVSPTTVHIRAASDQCGIIFSVDDDTRILLKRENGTIIEVTLAIVTAGRRAQGWASGPIAESCPAQAGAAVIMIL